MRFSRFYCSFVGLASVSASVLDGLQFLQDTCKCPTNPNYLVSSAVEVGDVTYYVPPRATVCFVALLDNEA